MRWFFVLFFIGCTAFAADEIQRIESVVVEIEQLRVNYETATQKLKACQAQLIEPIGAQEDTSEVNNLKNQLKYTQNILKSKEKEIEKLKSAQGAKKQKIQIKNEIYLNTQENTFPKLVMREAEVQHFKASTFRLKKESGVYDGVEGREIDRWDALTSFTSSMMQDGWIRITGYFVNKKWTKASKEMWVRATDAFKRD